jgi:hypothetical protein
MVLTTSEVAAVSLEGRAPVATRASPLLPGHLRGVIIELRRGRVRMLELSLTLTWWR